MLIALLSGESLAVIGSASYKISARVIGVGAATGSSTSFGLRGIVRGYYLQKPLSSSFIIGEGFLRSVYFYAILAPTVTEITPSTALNSGPVSITNLGGANFQTGSSVKLSKSGQTDITATDVNVVSTSKITCVFDITGAASGLWNVTVTGPDGRSGSLPSAFKIAYPAPTITSITPAKGVNNETAAQVTLAGTYFRSGASITLSKTGESDIIGESVVIKSAAKATCQFNLSGKNVGVWDVNLTNDDSQKGTLSGGFKIEAPVLEVKKFEITAAPNPDYPSVKTTSIKYELTKDADIFIDIFNMRGEKIWSTTVPAGTSGGGIVGSNVVTWSGFTAFNTIASAGVYIVYITSKVDGQTKLLSKQKIGIVK